MFMIAAAILLSRYSDVSCHRWYVRYHARSATPHHALAQRRQSSIALGRVARNVGSRLGRHWHASGCRSRDGRPLWWAAAPGLAATDRLTLLAAAVASASIVVIPLVVLSADRNIIGETVQPRYLLPMLSVVLGYLLITPITRSVEVIKPAQRTAIAVILIAAQSAALHANLRRYVTGQDELGFNLNNAEWWWPIAATPMMIWFAGSLSFGGSVILALTYCCQGTGSLEPVGSSDREPIVPAASQADVENSAISS